MAQKEERQGKKVLIRVELGGKEVARPMQMGRTDPYSVGLRDRHWMDNASNGLRRSNLERATSDQTTALTVARAANKRIGVFLIGKELRQLGIGGSNDPERSRGAGTGSNPGPQKDSVKNGLPTWRDWSVKPEPPPPSLPNSPRRTWIASSRRWSWLAWNKLIISPTWRLRKPGLESWKTRSSRIWWPRSSSTTTLRTNAPLASF